MNTKWIFYNASMKVPHWRALRFYSTTINTFYLKCYDHIIDMLCIFLALDFIFAALRVLPCILFGIHPCLTLSSAACLDLFSKCLLNVHLMYSWA